MTRETRKRRPRQADAPAIQILHPSGPTAENEQDNHSFTPRRLAAMARAEISPTVLDTATLVALVEHLEPRAAAIRATPVPTAEDEDLCSYAARARIELRARRRRALADGDSLEPAA